MNSILPLRSTTTIPDRYIWLSLAAFALIAARGIRSAITESSRKMAEREAWAQDTEALQAFTAPGGGEDHPSRGGAGLDDGQAPAAQMYPGQTEDSISLSTLRTLGISPNPQISAAAHSLLATRLNASPSTAATWLGNDLRSSDAEISRKAKTAVAWLQESGLASEVLAELRRIGAWNNASNWNEDDEYTYIPGAPELYAPNARMFGAENFAGYREDIMSARGEGMARLRRNAVDRSGLFSPEQERLRQRMMDRSNRLNREIDERNGEERRRRNREVVVVGPGSGDREGNDEVGGLVSSGADDLAGERGEAEGAMARSWWVV